MKYRRILAAFAALTVIMASVSCGKSEKTETKTDEAAVFEETTVEKAVNEDDEEKTTEKIDSNDKTTTKKADKESDKTTSTTKAGEKKSENKSATTTKKTGSSGSGNSGSNNEGGSADNGGRSDNNAASSGNTGSSASSGQEQGDNGSSEEIKEYTAEVTLGSKPTVKGSNVTVNGSTITITGSGDYIFTGTLSNGQIVVKTGTAATDDKVTLVLNGVNITNSSGPAIYVEEAKRCTVKPKEGSVNYLSDGGNDNINNAVIFSNDTLRLKGNGELNIKANNAHGIAGDDDVIVESGTYNITSVKSGIFAHDDVTVNDGYLDIKGGTNGIKSKGTININGGRTIVSGGTKEEKSSIYAAGSFNYTGGYVFAAGNKVSVPTYSENPYIVADLGESAAAGSEIRLYIDREEMAAFKPHNNFHCVMMLAPEINIGSSFSLAMNSMFSDTFNVNDGCNQFAVKFIGIE